MPIIEAAVTADPIDAVALQSAVATPTAGAVASFVGRIRDHDPEAEGEVVGIDYTHHPDAHRIIGEIAADVAAALDPRDEAHVALVHRVGRLAVGDPALVVVVATAHRRQAFEICEALVEAVKQRLPIWKQQTEASGRQVWSQLSVNP